MINHQHLHYDRQWGWQPIKARKIDVLRFVEGKEIVTPCDLVNWFGYTYNSARCRLSQLKKDGYVESFSRGQWCLTEKAYDKIHFLSSLEETVEEERQKQEKEVARLKQRVGELENHLSLLHRNLVRISGEMQRQIVPIVLLGKQNPKLGFEYCRTMFSRLLAELNELVGQSK